MADADDRMLRRIWTDCTIAAAAAAARDAATCDAVATAASSVFWLLFSPSTFFGEGNWPPVAPDLCRNRNRRVADAAAAWKRIAAATTSAEVGSDSEDVDAIQTRARIFGSNGDSWVSALNAKAYFDSPPDFQASRGKARRRDAAVARKSEEGSNALTRVDVPPMGDPRSFDSKAYRPEESRRSFGFLLLLLPLLPRDHRLV